MSLTDVIKKRRSVRVFDPSRKVTKQQLNALLEAARWAPSSGNLQDTYFLIIKDRKTKQKLIEKGACYQEFILDAPIIIIVCGRPEIISQKYGNRGLRYSILNSAAATQNILLAAVSLGLSSCWIGSFDDDRVREVLNINSSFLPLAILPIGHPAESPSAPERKSIQEISKII